jgi:hypothetical protein
MKSLLTVAGMLLFLLSSVSSAAQIVNPRITTDSSIDTSSAQAVVRQITNDKMTDQQKAIACWQFMLDHFYHWTPPKEPDTAGDVRDFAKTINTYGYSPCFGNSPVLSALWEACGFPTRCYTLSGHAIAEVKYGGTWHMLDADARGYHIKADGKIANVRELANDAKLITDPPGGKSKPFYPFGAPDVSVKPFVFWGPSSKMMDLYLSKKNNYQYNRRAVMGHPMYIALRKGETLTFKYANSGLYVKPAVIKPKAMKFFDGGPREVAGLYTYANGSLCWNPNLKDQKADSADIFWLGSKNVSLKDGRIVATEAGKPAVAIFRIWSPYALVAAQAKLTVASKEPAICSVSYDGGVAFTALNEIAWESGKATVRSAKIDLSRIILGRYEYLLKVELPQGQILGLSFNNTFQASQLTLPRLKPGINQITISRGPDEGHVQLVRAKGKQRKDRYILKSEGLDAKGLRPQKRDCSQAYAIFKLTAPAKLTAISLGANMTMDPGKKKQYIEALYSIDDGKSWVSTWKQPNHKNWGNSQFEMDKRIKLENASGSKTVQFKFVMARGSKYFGINAVRLYAFYKLTGAAGAKLNLELAWEKKDGDKWTAGGTKSLLVDKFPHKLEIDCGGQAARFSRIVMRPAR